MKLTMRSKPLPSQAALRKLFDYDPLTGVLRWRQTMGRRAAAGAVAGHLDEATGYWRVKVYGTKYYAHRLIWCWVRGETPELIDHRNGDRTDNRWANLRAASKSQNSANAGLSRRNSSGYKGVCFRPARGKFIATIRVAGTLRHLGYFASAAEASKAYRAAASKYFGVFAKEGK